MHDHFVYVKFHNNTNENLVNGWSAASQGYWEDFPSSISPHGIVSFDIRDNVGFKGSDGTFGYTIRTGSWMDTTIKTHQADPWGTDNNVIQAEFPKPTALYTISFRAKVGPNGQWTYNRVEAKGHPVWVEYTIEYEQKPFQFRLIQIRANSDHPVRNTRKELIVGDHTLWSDSDPSAYLDGTSGSFQPNVFAYEFGSQVAASSIMDVTVRALDPQLIGAEVLLFGIRNGKRVIQSGYFFFKNLDNITVRTHVLDPTSSADPFSFNAEVDWGMELRLSNRGLQRVGEGITRLELYWIATTLHRALKAYIPITLLRNVLLQTEAMILPTSDPYFTQRVAIIFESYNKIYDTMAGASHFGLTPYGGVFWAELYFEANDSGRPGTLACYVNSMDQAAILQLACSFKGPTSWLLQSPFGYIKDTHLVGVGPDATIPGNPLISANNPFHGNARAYAQVPLNNPIWTSFGCHVYVGHSSPWDPATDGIYDACSGPHTGNETIAQYITNSIDTVTTLYQIKDVPGPGTGRDVIEYNGLVGISPMIFLQSRTIPPLTEPLSRLVNITVTNPVSLLTHAGRANLPIRVSAALEDLWDVRYKQVSVGETGGQALWLIFDTDAPNSPIRVHVNMVSVVAEDGNLDMQRSSTVMKENISDILMSTERRNIWTPDILPGFVGVSLRYVDHVAAGRIVFVAGNAVMDISGMTSHEALLPYVLKLLNKTIRRDLGPVDHPAVAPVLQRQVIRMGTDTSGTTTVDESETERGTVTVTGINARFSLVFSVSCKIAAANAGSEGHGVLFDRYIVKELDDGEGCTVELFFITREVGRHRVRVCVAELETMIGANSDLEVEVVGA